MPPRVEWGLLLEGMGLIGGKAEEVVRDDVSSLGAGGVARQYFREQSLNICPMRPPLAKTEFEKQARTLHFCGEVATLCGDDLGNRRSIKEVELVFEIFLHEQNRGSMGSNGNHPPSM